MYLKCPLQNGDQFVQVQTLIQPCDYPIISEMTLKDMGERYTKGILLAIQVHNGIFALL